MEKAIITCALTQGACTKDRPDNAPTSPEEITAEAEAAVRAGAAVVRLNPLDESGQPSGDTTLLRRTIRMLRERLDCVVEVSALISAEASVDDRLKVLSVKPDIVAIPCGSANLGDQILRQPYSDLVQLAEAAGDLDAVTNLVCFDLSHVHTARRLVVEAKVKPPYQFSFVMGGESGISSDLRTLLHLVDALPRGASWSATGLGRAARLVAGGALLMGGHPRVGFEDSTLLRSKVKASRNADLVQMAVTVADAIGRDVAAPDEARALLATA